MSTSTALRALTTVAMTTTALVSMGAGTASAGEVTGNGQLRTVKGASICAYSGQNDGYHIPAEAHGPEDAAMRVQSYGHEREFLTEVLGLPKGLPGLACNPSGARG